MLNKIVCLLLLISMVCGCEKPKENDKFTVYTSFYAIYDFARTIAGDKAQVINLLPQGAEPHHFEPSAKDIAKIYESDMIVYCGGVDEYMENIIDGAEGIHLVNTGENIEKNGDDPHIWLSPDNAILQMENIKNALCEADPENSAYYEENYSSAVKRFEGIKALCDEIRESKKLSDIVVSHGAYGYLCDCLEISQLAAEGLQGESDPSAAKMAELADFIEEKNIKYIFSGQDENSKVMESLARETGTEVLELSAFEYDTQNRDYFSVMEANLSELKKALY